jgi:hypothetical protein
MNLNKTGKILRVAAIVLVGLTAAMNLLGGIGTTCAAFFTKKYPPFWSLYDFQWLYQTFVITTVLIGLAGIWTTVSLIRGGKNTYRNTVIVLSVGAVINIIHVVSSISLRGNATPANVVMGLNVLTLFVLLYLGTPGNREQVRFDQEAQRSEKAAAGGIAAIVSGVVVLFTPLWAGPTHTFQGQNWVDLLAVPLNLAGGALLIMGLVKLVRLVIEEKKVQSVPAESTSAM